MLPNLKSQNSKLKTITQRLKVLKFLAVVLTFNICVLSLPIPAYAQAATQSSVVNYQSSDNQSPPAPYPLTPLPATVLPTSPLYTDLLVNNLFHSFSCLAVGQSIIGQPCLTYQISKNAQGVIQTVPMLAQVDTSGGALGTVTSTIGALYDNRPVRATDYLASVGQGLGIVKEANAQGVAGSGAAVLNPILNLWQASRNIAYLLMIVIFLVIGLMVIFRNKINPQTVISAQAAIPGLVIGLVLITFSYFLAGLISDMAFVGTNLVGDYFLIAQNKDLRSEKSESEKLQNQNILKIFAPFTNVITAEKAWTALGSIWDDLRDPNYPRGTRLDPTQQDPQKVLSELAGFMFFQLMSPFASMAPGWGQIIAGAIAGLYSAVDPVHLVGVALSFIATVVLIYSMLKLLIRLVNAYLTIIFLTITAPFQFLAAALPGRQGLATGWILNMLANILAFPAVLAVLYFVAYLLGPDWINDKGSLKPIFPVTQLNQTEQNSLVQVAAAAEQPSRRIIDHAAFPLFGGMDLKFMEILLAFGALVALPKIPDIVASAVSKMSQAGQMIGQEIGGSIGEGRRYATQFQQGVGSAAGQVGRVTDQPFYAATEKNGKITWEKRKVAQPGVGSPIAGTASRARASVGSFFGSFRKKT